MDIVHLAVVVVALTLVFVTVRNRSERGAYAVIGVLLSIAIWQAADFLAGSTTGFGATLFWAKVVYTSVPVLVFSFFVFVLGYTGNDEYLTPRVLGLLAVEPIVYVGAIWTNQYHELFLSDATLSGTEYWGIDLTLGPVFTGHLLYSYAVVLVAIGLLVRLLRETQSLYPRQVYAVLTAVLAPFVADLLYQLGVVTTDLTPVAFTVTALTLTAALFQFKLLDVSPVTQESIAENIHDGLFVLDTDGEFVEINDVAREQLGLNDGTVVGDAATAVLSHAPEFRDAVVDADEGSREIRTTVGGDERFFRIQVTHLRDHRGELIGRQFLVSDITEQKRHERELKRQNTQLDRFASVVSHDLRNPLNVASGRLELAKETGDPEQFERVEQAHRRMEQLIEDVLALARDGQTIARTEPVSLRAVADAAWNNVQTLDATLTVEAELQVTADPDRLQRLLENLFRNSVEHGGPGVTVEVGEIDGGNDATPDGFYVADDGPGIPESDRDEVLDVGFTTAEDGTGLGLAIVSSIVTAHGWDVTITESDTGGARFEVAFVDATSDSRPVEMNVTD